MAKLRKSAKGRECQIRIPGVCNFNPETTVLCHLNGGGMGMKHPDLFGAFGCSACHDEIDGRSHNILINNMAIELYFYEGIFRTQAIWLKEGLISVK
jgi:hypothetical protein